MQRKNVKSVLEKLGSGKLTPEEESMAKYWLHQLNLKNQSGYSDEGLERVSDEMWNSIGKEQDQPRKTFTLWPRIATISTAWKIAAAVAVMTLGVWMYYFSTTRHPDAGQDPGSAQYANDIAPGKNTAKLTLANGEVINLSDQKMGVMIDASGLKYNDNTFVIQSDSEGSGSLGTRDDKAGWDDEGASSEVEMLTASTPRGGTYQIVLPDKSKVWLNADSKISFPSQFNGKERRIMLEGEAYFEVAKAFVIQSGAKDLNRRVRIPFIVETAGSGGRPAQRVEVLGTHFNINSYTDQSGIKTTLVEGSVRVNDLILKPNQQATLSNDRLEVKEADIKQVIAWKEGDFIFRQEPLESIMKQVARWYDVEVVYQTDVSKHRFDGMVSRSKNISSVLKMIELTGKVHFKVEGRRVTIID